ncbi:MAG: response regulator, partial [Verrucomicrobiota bacterium]|nr:response regulator [Verrucomicrobiota bacterium]
MSLSPNKKILIVEDEPDVVDLLALQLKKAGGFTVISAHDGAEGVKKARAEAPALIVLDLMLPRMPGLEVCKVLKTDSLTSHIPIIMLTAKAEEVDRIVGLEFGADDYVTKPFSPREMLLRIKAILRRGAGELAEEQLTRGPITLDSARHRV